MNTLEIIQKTREYLDYLEDHINNVNRAWQELQDKCKDMRFIYDDYVYFSIGDAVVNHDMSKLSKEEFIQYRIEFFPSDDENKKLQYSEFDLAWENHLKITPTIGKTGL